MIDLLLATALSCADANDLIDNINRSRTVDREELVDVIKTNTEPGCYERPERDS